MWEIASNESWARITFAAGSARASGDLTVAKKSFDCSVVTPSASLVSGKVAYAAVPAWDGSMGILPGRGAILARLGVGELRLEFADTEKGKGGEASYYVEGGVVKMSDNKLTILAEKAMPIEDLSTSGAEAELKAAMSAPAAGSALVAAEKKAADQERARVKKRLAKKA